VKAELLHQIEVLQRRRKQRVIILALAVFFIGTFCVAAFVTKPYMIYAIPKLDPSNRAVLLRTSGSGVVVGDRFLLFSDTATLKFSYEGHISEEWSVSKADQVSSLRVELLPEPKQLLLATNPITEVAWILNEEFINQGTSLTLEVVPNRTHTIEVLDYLGRSMIQQMEIHWKQTDVKELIFDLSKWAIAVSSEPDGAEVFAGGQQVGITPFSMVPGFNQDALTIHKDGFQSEDITISRLRESASPAIKVILKEVARSLPITLAPPGGELSGGALNASGSSVVPVLPMPSNITYYKKGFVAQTKVITSETKELNFDLKAATGEVLVTTPVGGNVNILGMGSRQIPVRLTLPIGDADLTVSSKGFQDQKIKVTVFQGQVKTLSPVLETIESYRARTARQRDQAPHSIFLQKIIGEPIELGASRNQTGQRANEVLRKVDFLRHFYFSETEISEEQFSKYSGVPSTSKLPVTGISWDEAAKFCNYLSQKQGFDPFYIISNDRVTGWNSGSIGYRLPTEAEWEYVASKYAKRRQRIFAWGDDYEIPEANFGNIADKAAEGKAKRYIADRSDGHAELAPIGFSEQVKGISDMSGNASEWVHDYYSITVPSKQSVTDYQGPLSGRQHFVKGSNYLSSSWTELRASYREPIDGARVDVGFRIARYVF
jgi:formylglycine-generating enzyme required for sulfatase activity